MSHLRSAGELPAAQQAQRVADYAELAALPEPARWRALGLRWAMRPASARDYARMHHLWQSEGQRSWAGKIESRHELKQWWVAITQQQRSA